MKNKIKLLIPVISLFFTLTLHAENNNQSNKSETNHQQFSKSYYDAEKVKIIKTHQLTTEGGYSGVEWSPDGEKILAHKGRMEDSKIIIFEIEHDNRDIEKIGELSSEKNKLILEGTFSPDSEKFAYCKYIGVYRLPEIWMAEIDDEGFKDKRKLTDGEKPSWSPDGKKIVYSSQRNKGLAVINIDGTGKEVLIRGKVYDPEWLPNNIISFAEWIPSLDRAVMTTINPNGTEKRRLIPEEEIGGDPLWWVPENRDYKEAKIFYGANRENNPVHVIMNANGTNKKVVHNLKTDPTSWSPDGSKLLYIVRGSDKDKGISWEESGKERWDDWAYEVTWSDIWVMNADGTGRSQLTNTHDMLEVNPQWSPDGKWILYTNEDIIEKTGNIYVSKITRHHDD